MSENQLYRTPFSPSYWRSAAAEFGNLRMLMLAALFIAIRIVISALYIPVGENQRVYFSFFVNAFGSFLYGPLVGLAVGFIHDIVQFALQPTGAFFPGYTLTAMLGAFSYAVFLYRTRITVLRLALCKLFVSLFVNVLLGACWSAILYSKGYYYYLVKSIAKNVIAYPFEVILLVLFFQLMLPIAAKAKITAPQPTQRIPWL